MLKVVLISMPYTIPSMPSIAIAQLQAVVRKALPEQVRIDSAYCYLDFLEFVGGLTQYEAMGAYKNKGLQEWMFRQAAFGVSDNIDAYRRFYFSEGEFPKNRKIFDLVAEKRTRIDEFLDDLIRRYALQTYTVVGFTSMMTQSIPSLALARRLKQLKPEIVTVLGGPNADHPMGKTLAANVPQIDFVFSGDGLVNFPLFLESMMTQDMARIASLKGVHGNWKTAPRVRGSLATASGEDGMPTTHRSPLPPPLMTGATADRGKLELELNTGACFDLNQMPMLDYTEYLDRLERSPFRKQLEPALTLPYQTAAGCWKADHAPCSFCGLAPYASRKMDPAKAREYLHTLIDRYAGRFAFFMATDPNMPREYPEQVFAHVNQAKSVPIQCELSSKMLADDLARLASANVVLPQPGIESLSTATLGLMHKGVTAFHNIRFLKHCTELGLYPIWNYLYGLPNPDYDELRAGRLVEIVRTLRHLPPPAGAIPILFTRYSEYFDNAAKFRLKLRPAESYSYLYPFGASVVSDLAYHFEDQSFSRELFAIYGAALQAAKVEVVNWMSQFRSSIPKLHFVEELVIEDTRAQPTRHPITPTERRVLDFLDLPHSVDQVVQALNLPRPDVERMIHLLEQKRLLFSERGQYLNVVCARCSLSTENYKHYYVTQVKSAAIDFE